MEKAFGTTSAVCFGSSGSSAYDTGPPPGRTAELAMRLRLEQMGNCARSLMRSQESDNDFAIAA